MCYSSTDSDSYNVQVNDLYQDGRYEVLNKLGSGSFSTVWVAQDHYKHVDVSLKVMRAKFSENNQELRVLQHIRQSTTEHPGKRYLPQLLDHFYQEDTGIYYLVLDLELLGPMISQVSLILPGRHFSLSSARQVSLQLLLAIDCLHSYGIVHADIHEGSVLRCLPENHKLELRKVHEREAFKMGKVALGTYIEPLDYEQQFDQAELAKLNNIKLIDFSSSFFESDPLSQYIITPAHVSPPESIFKMALSKSIDIWSLACTTFYISTGEELFFTLADKRHIIPQIHRVIGEASAHWILTALLEAVQNKIWKDFPDLQFTDYKDCSVLEETLLDYDIGQRSTTDAERHLRALTQYLRKSLIVDPSKRANTEDLRAEEWVQVRLSG